VKVHGVDVPEKVGWMVGNGEQVVNEPLCTARTTLVSLFWTTVRFRVELLHASTVDPEVPLVSRTLVVEMLPVDPTDTRDVCPVEVNRVAAEAVSAVRPTATAANAGRSASTRRRMRFLC
jgi:hypothetical protein